MTTHFLTVTCDGPVADRVMIRLHCLDCGWRRAGPWVVGPEFRCIHVCPGAPWWRRLWHRLGRVLRAAGGGAGGQRA